MERGHCERADVVGVKEERLRYAGRSERPLKREIRVVRSVGDPRKEAQDKSTSRQARFDEPSESHHISSHVDGIRELKRFGFRLMAMPSSGRLPVLPAPAFHQG